MDSPFQTSSFRDGALAPDPESRHSGLDASHRPGMTDSNERAPRASNFPTGHRDRLPRDRTGTIAAQPQHRVGDFRRRHETPLRIMFGKFGNRLRMAAAGPFYVFVQKAAYEIGIGEAGAHRIHRHVR